MLAILLMCEAGLRVRAWIKYGSTNPDIDDSFVFLDDIGLTIPRPGYETHGRSASVKVNSLGFRGEEFTQQKPVGTVRIVCLGASTTFCTGSSNATTWPQLLEEQIRKKHPNGSWQVINAGVPGHTMSAILKNLKHRVLPLDPDLVIFYEAQNQLAVDTAQLARDRGVIAADERNISPTVAFLSHYSLLFNLGHKNLRIMAARNDSNQAKLNGLPPDLNKKYVESLAEIHSVLKGRGVPLVTSPFLVKFRRDQERSVQIANADIAFFYMPWMSIDDLLDGVDAYNKGLVDYAKANGLPVVEETTSIPADGKHFVDCIHFADAGNVIMANRFFTLLDQGGTLQRLMDTRQQGK